MSEQTKIEWCDHSWSPWIGCTKVSPGCANCYAADMMDHRFRRAKWGPEGTRPVTSEENWKKPLAWDRKASRDGVRRKVFCAPAADVFEDWPGPMMASNGNPLWWCYGSLSNSPLPSTGLPDGCRMATMDDIRERLFDLIRDTPHLDWLLLTKRPERWRQCWPLESVPGHVQQNSGDGKRWADLPNVWMGTSVENQEWADKRIPHLLACPATVRFLSCEPLLSAVDLAAVPQEKVTVAGVETTRYAAYGARIDWVIVGGESGSGARPCQIQWIESLINQCRTANVACFVKQLGAFPCDGAGFTDSLALKDRKGGEPDEWPTHLRVREFPNGKES